MVRALAALSREDVEDTEVARVLQKHGPFEFVRLGLQVYSRLNADQNHAPLQLLAEARLLLDWKTEFHKPEAESAPVSVPDVATALLAKTPVLAGQPAGASRPTRRGSQAGRQVKARRERKASCATDDYTLPTPAAESTTDSTRPSTEPSCPCDRGDDLLGTQQLRSQLTDTTALDAERRVTELRGALCVHRGPQATAIQATARGRRAHVSLSVTKAHHKPPSLPRLDMTGGVTDKHGCYVRALICALMLEDVQQACSISTADVMRFKDAAGLPPDDAPMTPEQQAQMLSYCRVGDIVVADAKATIHWPKGSRDLFAVMEQAAPDHVGPLGGESPAHCRLLTRRQARSLLLERGIDVSSIPCATESCNDAHRGTYGSDLPYGRPVRLSPRGSRVPSPTYTGLSRYRAQPDADDQRHRLELDY